jgi:hypothetical protein
MTTLINLANGSQVTIDEFISWSSKKQLMNVTPRKPMSAETRANMAAGKTGTRQSPEHRASISAGQKRRYENKPELKKHLSQVHKNRLVSPEARARMSARNAFKGKPISEERRAALQATARPLMTPNGLYPNARAVVEASGYSINAVRRWVKKYPEHYYYIPKDTK